MSYGLYMYKEFPTISGRTIRLEIFERDFAGAAVEIEAMSSAPVFLTTDNMNNEVFMPVIKSNLSIIIKDTEQIDYSVFFTPDATKFKVYVKVDGTTEWAGYLTPDSFNQSLSYRNDINLIARDNLGMLAEFPFDNFNDTASIYTTLQAAFTKIGFLSTVEYRSIKVDSEGANITTGLTSLKGFEGLNYYEVVEKILRGMGCQLRFVGGNKYAIFDVGDLANFGEANTSQNFLFIEKSGIMELIPAWKDITVSQTYGINTQIYDGILEENSYRFITTRNVYCEYDLTPPRAVVPVRFYEVLGNRWGGTLRVASPYDFTNVDKGTILLPLQDFSFETLRPSIQYSRVIAPYDKGLIIKFDVHNALYMPDLELYGEGKMVLTDKTIDAAEYYNGIGIWIRYNVFLQVGETTYILKNNWEEYTGGLYYNQFLVQRPFEEQDDDSRTHSISDIPLSISISTLKTGGTLSFHLYGYDVYYTGLVSHSYYDFLCAIKNITFNVEEVGISGRTTTATIDANYNVRGGIDLEIGEIPASTLNNLVNLGGIFKNTTFYPPMTGFNKSININEPGTVYHLSELIGREIAHHYKTTKKKLSGSIINSTNYAAFPHFGKAFTDGTLTYALNYGSLDFANEVMQVELVEVEAYETEDFTFVEAAIDGGGGTSLGSGNTTFIQWSAAGNATRIYALDTATEAEQGGAYVVIDKSGLASAKKVALLDLLVDAYTKTESDAKYHPLLGLSSLDFTAKKLVSTTLLVPQVPSTLSSGEIGLYALESGFVGEVPSGAGSVTSVGLSMPTGFSVASSPITESGTLAVTFASGYFVPTTTQWATKLDTSLKGSVNGLAELDANGFVKNTQLPSYIDDVIEADNFAALPATGEAGKIYVTKDDNKTWRWGGSVYVQMYAGIALGETSATAYRGDRGKTAYDHSQLVTGNPHGTTAADVGALALGLKYIDQRTITPQTFPINSFQFGFTSNDLANGSPYSDFLNFGGYPDGSGGRKNLILFAKDNFGIRQYQGDFAATSYNHGFVDFWHSGNSGSTSFNWSAAKLTSTTLLLPQSAPTLASGEMAIYGLESGFSGELPSGAGSVTSIALTVPTGLRVKKDAGGTFAQTATITESGEFIVEITSGYTLPTSSQVTDFTTAFTNRITSLTTTGSGMATLAANVLNIPTYSLPTATDTILGGVKRGTNVTITEGVISVHNPITLGENQNGLSLSTQVLSLGLASTSTNGALSSTDWNTFNGKAAGDHAHTFAVITDKPTTISGYGITDAITTGNIGSQSVANADTLGNSSKDYFVKTRQGYVYNMNNAGNYLGNSTFYWTPDTIGSAGGYGVCLALSDGVSWYNQLGFSTNGDIVFRNAINTTDFTGIGWVKLYHTGNLTSTLTSGYLPYWNGSSLVNAPLFYDLSNRMFKMEHSGGTTLRIGNSYDTLVSGDLVGSIEFWNNDADTPKIGAYIKSVAREYFGRTGELSFGVSRVANEQAVEVARFNEAGNFLIHYNVGIGYTDRTEKLAVNGSGYFNGGLSLFSGAASGTTFLHTKQAAHQYLWIDGNGSYESMIRHSNSNGGWYVGMRIANTLSDYQFYSTIYSATVASLSEAGALTLNHFLKATSIKIGSSWEVIPNGTTGALEFNNSGTKASLSTTGILTLAENINTNLRIPKVAPTSPTSGEYYFYIVE